MNVLEIAFGVFIGVVAAALILRNTDKLFSIFKVFGLVSSYILAVVVAGIATIVAWSLFGWFDWIIREWSDKSGFFHRALLIIVGNALLFGPVGLFGKISLWYLGYQNEPVDDYWDDTEDLRFRLLLALGGLQLLFFSLVVFSRNDALWSIWATCQSVAVVSRIYINWSKQKS